MGYKFDKDKFITIGIKENLVEELQYFIFDVLERLTHSEMELDYLQIFNISNDKRMVKILHSQEVPPFEREYNILDEEIVDSVTDDAKLYVIHSDDNILLMYASEYWKKI